MLHRVDISYKTIVFITIFFLLLWMIYLIRDIILLFFVAFIFVSALTPFVKKLLGFRFPKVLAVFLPLFSMVAVIVALLTIGFTPLISQTSNLSQRLADILAMLLQSNLIDQSVINQELSNFSHQIVGLTLGVFENLIAVVSIIVVTFYFLLDREKIENKTATLFGDKGERVQKLISRIEDKLGAWLRGQLVLSALIGVMVYVGLMILGIEFALPLAIIAALFEVIPILGPIISAIPAIIIALTISPVMAGIVAGLYLAIQQIEGHIVVPQVMKRAVGLNPLLVILSVAVGGRLLGIGGALLAVPIAVVIQVVLEEILKPQEA